MRILGIDPGTRITGFGCVEFPAPARGPIGVRARRTGATLAGEVLVDAGVFRLKATLPLDQRLMELEADLVGVMAELKPDVLAVEALFTHVDHPATALVMAHARGVVLLAGRRAGLTLVEVRPAEVKKAIAAHGRAGKDQMQRAVQAEFGLAEPPRPADVADALAVALCAGRRAGR